MTGDRWIPLRSALEPVRDGAIAVSGGVDSTTLAAFAHDLLGANGVRMVHAISPAVPAAATARVRDHAARLGWSLSEVDAGEFNDPHYRANPVNRCFYCKSNLYGTLRRICDGVIMSGTNTNDLDDGAGTMEALYFGNAKGGLNHGGAGKGPWIMADMENALWGADVVKSNERPINHDYVTAMIKGDVSTNAPGGHWAIKGGDATNGTLKVYWDGKRAPGYAPMKKQGAIILGIGGDNSDGAVGTFYEGVMTKGYTSNAADEAVQANIVAAGYGR